MNSTTLNGNWTEIKGKIKTQWAKLNDNHVEELQGNLDQLIGKIQQVYGYGKEQAELEFNEFKKSITTNLNAATTAAGEKVDEVLAETKNKSTLPMIGAILLAGMMNACSSSPVVDEYPNTANPTEEVSSLNSDLNTAESNQINVLSPNHFKDAKKSLGSAQKSLDQQKEPRKTLHEVAEGRAHLGMANQFAKTAHANIEDVIIARQSAIQAGAPGFFANDMAKVDRKLMDVTSQIEKNDIADAAKNRTELQTSYRGLELKSIKETHLAGARNTIDLAIKEGAKEYAPRSLAIAQKSVLDTDAYITANRQETSKVSGKAKETTTLANHLLKITRDAKLGKKSTAEDSALAMEAEQNKVGAKQVELNSAQTQLNDNRNQLSDSKNEVHALSVENKDLASEQDFNRSFEAARAEFTSSEAEVYKKGNNLIIRLRGLEFPSSKAVLKGSNFPLLAKVQKVMKNFGNSSVIVEGHTDSIGGKQANEKLSSDRAEAVKQYFTSNAGSDALDISSVGYGYQKPLATNKTASGRAQNRRVDVIIQAKTPSQI